MEIRKLPLVSVIIPVYNGEQYIRTCIENILNQTYKNLEIIVVNDGSVDQSGEIAEKFPIRVIHMPENRGLSAARNAGINTATGGYIHFMDVDDTINIDYYKNLIDAVILTGAEVACGGMVNEKLKHKTICFKKLKSYLTTQEKLSVTYVGKWGYVWRYLFSMDFLNKHHLRFEEGRYIEDLIFSLSAVYFTEKLVVVPNTAYNYRESENSIMTKIDQSHRDKVHQDWLHAESRMYDFANQHNFKIPGVNTGKLNYIWWKVGRLWTNSQLSVFL